MNAQPGLFNTKGFFPTPKALIARMVDKVQGHPEMILEPSAGKGDLIDGMTRERFRSSQFSAIESDENLQAILTSKGIKVIDSDFLAYSGPDKFDLIIANPPFENGELHLLKAIDILYRGQIIFLLNAETIRNPYTNMRKLLEKKLTDLHAEIEFIEDAFLDGAERKTGVEVALVYIKIDRSVEDDLFKDADEKVFHETPGIGKNQEVSTRKVIVELVAEYKQVIQIGTETIIGYYRNFPKVGKYIGLNKEPKSYDDTKADMTGLMQSTLNELLAAVRVDFWRRTLDLPEVRKRMTSKKRDEFEEQLKIRCNMDFTESNIRQFVINLIGSYEKTLTEAVI